MLQRSLIISLGPELDVWLGEDGPVLIFFVTITGPAGTEDASELCAEAKAARLAKGIKSGFTGSMPNLHTVRHFFAVALYNWISPDGSLCCLSLFAFPR